MSEKELSNIERMLKLIDKMFCLLFLLSSFLCLVLLFVHIWSGLFLTKTFFSSGLILIISAIMVRANGNVLEKLSSESEATHD